MPEHFKTDIRYLTFLKGFSKYYATNLPYTDEYIDSIEEAFGVVFPQCYRELCLLTGLYFCFPYHRWNADGTVFHRDQVELKATLQRLKKNTLPATSPIFVFQPNLFFRLDEGPNPPVYEYDSAMGVQTLAATLSDYINRQPWCRAYRDQSTRDDNHFIDYPKKGVFMHGKLIHYETPPRRALKYCRFLQAYNTLHQTANMSVPDHACKDSDVDRLEKMWGFKFPEAYRELYLIVGEHRAINPGMGSSYGISEFSKMQQMAREYFTEENLVFDESMVVFSLSNEYPVIWFFRLDEGENPPVYWLDGYGDHVLKKADSFTLYLAKSLYPYTYDLKKHYATESEPPDLDFYF